MASASLTQELKVQLLLGLPQSCSSLARRCTDAFTLSFVGALGDPVKMAAAGLANSTNAIFSLSVFVGLSSATVTLTSQAKGAGDNHQAALWLHRALAVHFVVAAIFTPVMFALFGPMLLALGQDVGVIDQAVAYYRCLLPGMWAWATMFALFPWLQCYGVVRTPLLVGVCMVPVHLVALKLYVRTWGLGMLGAGLAASTTIALNVLMTGLLTFVLVPRLRSSVPRAWPGPDSLARLPTFLRLGCPGVLTLGEWWASEIGILLTGLLPEPAINLSAMSVYQTMNAIAFMWPLGASYAGGARVGAALGGGSPAGARRAGRACMILGLGQGVVATLALLMLRERVARLFTPDSAVIQRVLELLPNLLAYVVADAGQVAANGILTGCGRQKQMMPVVIISYYGIGLPSGAALAFWAGWGARGVVSGLLIGKLVHFAAFIVLLLRTDWDAQVRDAAKRVAGETRSKALPELQPSPQQCPQQQQQQQQQQHSQPEPQSVGGASALVRARAEHPVTPLASPTAASELSGSVRMVPGAAATKLASRYAHLEEEL
jgi:MATE family multidrug resistance protein